MSLDGVSSMSPELKAFIAMVRTYTRDHPELNRLTAGHESGERMIAFAVADALSLYNSTPPFTGMTLQQLLQKNMHSLLLRLTVITLLESVALLSARNHLNYSAGGLNVGMNDKAPLLMNFLQYYKASTDQQLQRVKIALNIESILGADQFGVASEYWFVNNSFLAY